MALASEHSTRKVLSPDMMRSCAPARPWQGVSAWAGLASCAASSSGRLAADVDSQIAVPRSALGLPGHTLPALRTWALQQSRRCLLQGGLTCRTDREGPPSLVKMRSAGVSTAWEAGTQQPIWARMHSTQPALSSVDLPPMLGPVRSSTFSPPASLQPKSHHACCSTQGEPDPLSAAHAATGGEMCSMAQQRGAYPAHWLLCTDLCQLQAHPPSSRSFGMTEPLAPGAAQGFHSWRTSSTARPVWGTSCGRQVGPLLDAENAANATRTSRVDSASCRSKGQGTERAAGASSGCVSLARLLPGLPRMGGTGMPWAERRRSAAPQCPPRRGCAPESRQ